VYETDGIKRRKEWLQTSASPFLQLTPEDMRAAVCLLIISRNNTHANFQAQAAARQTHAGLLRKFLADFIGRGFPSQPF